MRTSNAGWAALVVVLAGCGAGPGPTTSGAASIGAPPSSASPSHTASTPVEIDGSFDIGGYELRLACDGTGSPTVVFDAGLGGNGTTWLTIQDELSDVTRVCRYDRAGLGGSQPRPGNPSTSAGEMADELWRLLDVAGVDGPLVLAGHSYGGMTVRLVAHEHPDRVLGLVLVDSASVRQFQGEWFRSDQEWFDGTANVDRIRSEKELLEVTSLGAIPLVVLTQGQMNGSFAVDWSRFQDELAALSTSSVHVVAKNSDHMIQENAPDLVVEGVREVVDAVRSGGSLPPCGMAWVTRDADCVETSMSDQVAAWQAVRAAVKPAAGSFPAGTYRVEITGAEVQAVTGLSQDWSREVDTWTLAKGRWSIRMVTDGGDPEIFSDVYAAGDDEIVIRIPDNLTMPRTAGVNRLTWTVDPDGTVHFTQIDDELREPEFTVPWVRVR
jgi:hypothetical protein